MPSNHETVAGASARAEYERRRQARLDRHEARFGRLAWLTSRIDGEPQTERNWRRGAEGEERVGMRLEKLLRDRGVVVLNDLRIPGTRANIDHLTIGPGGVTVIDAKRYRGKARVHRGKLWVGGRNRTKLVEGVKKQVEVVRAALAAEGLAEVDVIGAICWTEVDGLPLLGRLKLQGVRIDGSRAIARLARRRGRLGGEGVDRAAGAVIAALGTYG